MLHIRTMTPADLSLGMSLKAQAGWNQTEADWRRFLALQPDGGFVAERDGSVVGTAVALGFGPVAWVAMVLVEASQRGRGIGTALMRHALDFLDARGVRSIRLDATPMGRPVYEKLGFLPEYTLARFEGTLSAPDAVPSGVAGVAADDLAACLALDRQVTRTDRSRLLRLLHEEAPEAFRLVSTERPAGFLASRVGVSAVQIGPLIATDPGAARRLLQDAQARLAGRRVFIDVPLPNSEAVAAVEALGLTVQRHLLRMGRGETVSEDIAGLWASSGPEKG